jgi:hypothetical protein
VNLRGVFQHSHVLALRASETQFGDGCGSVGEETLFVRGIDPGAGYYAGAVARADLVLIGIYEGVERGGIDQAFFDQQRFESFDAESGVGWDGLVVVMVIVIRHWACWYCIGIYLI